MSRPLRAVKLALAALLLLRLGGVAAGWVPSAAITLIALLLLLDYESADRAFARRGERLSAEALGRWAHAHAFPLALGAVTAAALALRLYGITSNLDHVALGIDENRLNASILHLFSTGDIDYRTVEHYPGIHYWMLTAAYLLAYMWGLMTHVADTFAAMPVHHFAGFGRLVSALQSTATVALTGLLGRHVAGGRAGLLAAFTLALAPLSVSLGRQLRNDASATLFAVAAVLIALALLRRDFAPHQAVLGGALAGLAAGIKYTGVFVVLPVLLAAALCEERTRRWRAVGLVTVGFVATALLSNHFVWADLPNLLDQLSDQILITGEGHWAAQDNPSAYHAAILAQRVLGWPLLVLAAATTAYRLAAGSRRWWVLALFPLTYLWFVAQRPSQLPRWVYPEAPFAAVAAGAGLVAIVDLVRARLPAAQGAIVRRAVAVLVALLLLAPLLSAATSELGRRLSAPTYAVTERWLQDNTQPGDRVLVQRRWLQLDTGQLRVERANLADVLDGGFYQLAAHDWIVVHEPLLAHPALDRLELAELVAVDPRFFGNQGPNFAIYRPPPVAPAEVPMAVSLAAPAAADHLGHDWRRGGDGVAGVPLPEVGAGLYLPPLGTARLQLDLIVAPPDGGDTAPAIAVWAGGRELAVQRSGDGDNGSIVFRVELPLRVVGPGIVSLRLRPAPGSGPVRVRGFRLY
jgi:4-amino-4-deoxy-L-arabinose transferase-like glycosyltransferase